MRWTKGYRSRDVEIRKGGGLGGGGLGGGIGMLLSLIGSRFGIVGILLAIGAYFLLSRGGMFGGGTQQVQPQAEVSDEAKSDPRVEFVSFVFDDVQSTWSKIFAEGGEQYPRAKMVLFEGSTATGCGYGQSATGPFYCPQDQQVYLDLSFFRTLESRLGARGDFAQAYVIAHEVGHHVQRVTGLMERSGSGVPLELQADCFAGVWASSTGQRNLLEEGDLEEAINAAAAVGDDRLQEMAQGTVQPEKWTHGSSAQRASWFRRGYEGGDPELCDTSGDLRAGR
jgi:hypothetical protein